MFESRSTYFNDGYCDAIELRQPSLPGAYMPDQEYLDGYCVAVCIVKDALCPDRTAPIYIANRKD